mmetsp:Transcript_15380/g.33229  ORF Transcript_15380/g.33229 Transcript_15380/m.33229 type:complete len:250 (+) Transcript_15380:514-1263(+)
MAPQTQMHDDIVSLASNNETVKLNVGGKKYETSWAVISSVEKLSALAYERWVEDPEDEIFVDRDGIRFRYCLDYFRDGKVVIPRSETRESILNDLKYFGVASPDTDAIQYAEDFDDGSKENNLPLKDNPPATQAIKFIFNLDNEVNRCSSKHSSLVFVQAVVKYLLSSTKENSFTETRTLTLSNFGSTANATLYAQAAKVHNEMNGAKTPTKEDLIEDFYSHAGLKFVSIHCGVDGQGSCSYVIKFEKE